MQKFKLQSFRESLYERLGRRIGSCTWNPLERQQRTHQNQPAAPLGHKLAGKVVGELDDSTAIHVNHFQLWAERAIDEPPGSTKPSNGSQHPDFEIVSFRHNFTNSVSFAEIDGERPYFNAMFLRQIGCEGLDRFSATRDKNQIKSSVRQLRGHRLSDSIRSSGYERPRPIVRP
jgi:hypothetical protein